MAVSKAILIGLVFTMTVSFAQPQTPGTPRSDDPPKGELKRLKKKNIFSAIEKIFNLDISSIEMDELTNVSFQKLALGPIHLGGDMLIAIALKKTLSILMSAYFHGAALSSWEKDREELQKLVTQEEDLNQKKDPHSFRVLGYNYSSAVSKMKSNTSKIVEHLEKLLTDSRARLDRSQKRVVEKVIENGKQAMGSENHELWSEWMASVEKLSQTLRVSSSRFPELNELIRDLKVSDQKRISYVQEIKEKIDKFSTVTARVYAGFINEQDRVGLHPMTNLPRENGVFQVDEPKLGSIVARMKDSGFNLGDLHADPHAATSMFQAKCENIRKSLAYHHAKHEREKSGMKWAYGLGLPVAIGSFFIYKHLEAREEQQSLDLLAYNSRFPAQRTTPIKNLYASFSASIENSAALLEEKILEGLPPQLVATQKHRIEERIKELKDPMVMDELLSQAIVDSLEDFKKLGILTRKDFETVLTDPHSYRYEKMVGIIAHHLAEDFFPSLSDKETHGKMTDVILAGAK